MTFTPTQLRRIERTLHPVAITPKTGLEPLCRLQNVSHSSVRRFMSSGLTREEAVERCREQGLTFIPRGIGRWEARSSTL